MRHYVPTVVSVMFAAILFAMCLTLLGLICEGYRLDISSIWNATLIYGFINFSMLSFIRWLREFRPKDASLAAFEEAMPDFAERMTFHWSLSVGIISILLTALCYGLSSPFLDVNYYYVYLILALMPFSPWFGSYSLADDGELNDGTPLITMFFHV